MAVEIASPAWLQARLEDVLTRYLAGVDDLTLAELERPRGGQSNETVILRARCVSSNGASDRKIVLRLQPAAGQMFVDADVVAEGELVRALGEHGSVPVPAVIAIEPDPDVVGRPFFLMEFVDGHVPGGRPSVHLDPWLRALSPNDRGRVWRNGLELIARLHLVDPGALSLGRSLPVEPDIDALRRWYAWAAEGARFELIESAIDHLEHAAFARSSPVVLWGDARPGNLIVRDDTSVAAAIDWELAAIGPPEIDVGWWLMMDDFADRGAGGARSAGLPTAAETIAIYEEASGRRLGDLSTYALLAAVKLAITLLPAAASLRRRGIIGPDSRFAHENVPTQMIADHLGVEPPPLCADYARLSRMDRMASQRRE